jgi:hypothetical protein
MTPFFLPRATLAAPFALLFILGTVFLSGCGKPPPPAAVAGESQQAEAAASAWSSGVYKPSSQKAFEP